MLLLLCAMALTDSQQAHHDTIERAIYERIEADRAAISDIWQPSRRPAGGLHQSPNLLRQGSSLSSPKLRYEPCPGRERSRQGRDGASRPPMIRCVCLFSSYRTIPRRVMEQSIISNDKQLIRKVEDRLARLSRLHSRAGEATRTKQDCSQREGPPLPFLYQG